MAIDYDKIMSLKSNDLLFKTVTLPLPMGLGSLELHSIVIPSLLTSERFPVKSSPPLDFTFNFLFKFFKNCLKEMIGDNNPAEPTSNEMSS